MPADSKRFAAAFGLIFAVVIALHLAEFTSEQPGLLHELLDIAHAVGFALVTLVCGALILKLQARYAVSDLRVLVLTLAVPATLALLSEAAQSLTIRDPSVSDLIRDAWGITAGYCVLSAWQRPGLPRFGLAAAGVVALAVGIAVPGRNVLARATAPLRLPVLASFDGFLERPLIHGARATVERIPAPAGWPSGGEVARVVPSGRGRFPGISFVGLPRDWTAYSRLSFVVASDDGREQQLTLRIHDVRHNNQYADRYNLAVTIDAEPRRISVDLADVRKAPRGRELSLRDVDGLIVFVSSDDPGPFLIDDVRLE